MFEFTCFRRSHQKLFGETDTLRYQNSCSADFCERVLVKLLYAYSSTNGKLLLKMPCVVDIKLFFYGRIL